MKYLENRRDWKYEIQSALFTFLAMFSMFFINEIYSFGFHDLSAQEITPEIFTALFSAVWRSAFVAIIKSLFTFKK